MNPEENNILAWDNGNLTYIPSNNAGTNINYSAYATTVTNPLDNYIQYARVVAQHAALANGPEGQVTITNVPGNTVQWVPYEPYVTPDPIKQEKKDWDD